MPADSPILERVTNLKALLEERETSGTLTALMPAEPVVGEVAIAVWAVEGHDDAFELVRLDDGTTIDDQAALRETLALIAMAETLEELASFDVLDELRESLDAWVASAQPGEQFSHAHARAREKVDALAELEPESDLRMARTQTLDAIALALRNLEDRWQLLEQAAELWSDAHLADAGDAREARVAEVQELWRILGIARRGPLATPPSTAVHAGREAGVALAEAITGGD